MDEDEEFNQAFGEHTGISEDCRDIINLIRNDDLDINILHDNKFGLDGYDVGRFNKQAWTLLGRYIANNTHLNNIYLNNCGLTDEMMALLFKELVRSVSLHELHLDSNNPFGIEGVRSMLPLLSSSPNLSVLYLSGINNINTECFRVLISALDGKSIKELYFERCNITDISALDRYNLPNLQELNLDCNKIGREGIITLSRLLQKENTTLKQLHLRSMDMGDDGAKIIASSLKHNTKLKELHLNSNGIKREGCLALLKLLIDISSIDNTYDSNHTLSACHLGGNISTRRIKSLFDSACFDMNNDNPNSHTAGREKVIRCQLDSQKRKEICQVQDIEYTPGSIFADIEPVLLPQILALIGERHGQSELYSALIHTAPDLLSYIDRKAFIDSEIAKNIAQADTLRQQANALMLQASVITAKNDQLNRRREMIEIRDSKQQSGGEGNKKRKMQH